MAEKGKKKHSPISQTSWQFLLGLSSASSISLPAPDFLAGALLWRKSLFGAAMAEPEQREQLQGPGMSPAGHCARNAPPEPHPKLQPLQTPSVSRFPQPSTGARAKCGCASSPQGCSHVPSPGSGRAGRHIPTLSVAKPPSCDPPSQRSRAGRGMSPKGMSSAIPQSPLQGSSTNYRTPGEQTARERSGLDWAGLVKSACPDLGRELQWGRQRDTFTLSKAQPEKRAILPSKCTSLLLIKCLRWLEEPTLMKFYHSLYQLPMGVPAKLYRQPQKSGIVLHPIWRKNKSCWQSKTSSRYSGYIQPRTRKRRRKKKNHPRL